MASKVDQHCTTSLNYLRDKLATTKVMDQLAERLIEMITTGYQKEQTQAINIILDLLFKQGAVAHTRDDLNRILADVSKRLNKLPEVVEHIEAQEVTEGKGEQG